MIFLAIFAAAVFMPNNLIAGDTANTVSYPFYARLLGIIDQSTGRGSFCGGSLIAPNWVLTAGHCVTGNNLGLQAMYVAVADAAPNIDTLWKSGHTNIRRAKKVVPHPDYRGNGVDNDIALVELESPFASSFDIRTISLSQPNMTMPFKVVGFGIKDATNGPSQSLEQASIKVGECPNLSVSKKDNVVCLSSSAQDIRLCEGDSGGPLIVETDRGFELAGVASAIAFSPGNETMDSYSQCVQSKFSVFVSVQNYMDFIQSAIATNLKSFSSSDSNINTSSCLKLVAIGLAYFAFM